MLAAHLFVRDSPTPVTLGTGVLLGLLAGAIGAVVDTLFTIPIHMALRGSAEVTEQMREWADEIPNLPEQSREILRTITSGGTAVGSLLFVVTAFFKLIVYGAVAMIGGALGVALFEKRKIGTATPDIRPPYEPPSGPPPPPPSDAGGL